MASEPLRNQQATEPLFPSLLAPGSEDQYDLSAIRSAAYEGLRFAPKPVGDIDRSFGERLMSVPKHLIGGVVRGVGGFLDFSGMLSDIENRFPTQAPIGGMDPVVSLFGGDMKAVRKNVIGSLSEHVDRITERYFAYPEELESRTWENLRDIDWWVSAVPSGLGQFAMQVASGGAAGGVLKAAGVGAKAAMGMGMVATGFALESGASYQEMRDDLVRRGLPREEAVEAAAGGAVVYGVIAGLLEKFGSDAVLGAFRAKPGGMAQALRDVASGAGIEGGTEAVQSSIADLTQEITTRLADGRFDPSSLLKWPIEHNLPVIATQSAEFRSLLASLVDTESLYQAASEGIVGAVTGGTVSAVGSRKTVNTGRQAEILSIALMSIGDSEMAQLVADLNTEINGDGQNSAQAKELLQIIEEIRQPSKPITDEEIAGVRQKLSGVAMAGIRMIGQYARDYAESRSERQRYGDDAESLHSGLNDKILAKGVDLAAQMLAAGISPSSPKFGLQSSSIDRGRIRDPKDEVRIEQIAASIIRSKDPNLLIGVAHKVIAHLKESKTKVSMTTFIRTIQKELSSDPSEELKATQRAEGIARLAEIRDAMYPKPRSQYDIDNEVRAAEAFRYKLRVRDLEKRLEKQTKEYRAKVEARLKTVRDRMKKRLDERLKSTIDRNDTRLLRLMYRIDQVKAKLQQSRLDSSAKIAELRSSTSAQIKDLREKYTKIIRELRESERQKRMNANDNRIKLLNLVSSYVDPKYQTKILKRIIRMARLDSESLGSGGTKSDEATAKNVALIDRAISEAIRAKLSSELRSTRKKFSTAATATMRGGGAAGLVKAFHDFYHHLTNKDLERLTREIRRIFFPAGPSMRHEISPEHRKALDKYASDFARYKENEAARREARLERARQNRDWIKNKKVGPKPAVTIPDPVPAPEFPMTDFDVELVLPDVIIYLDIASGAEQIAKAMIPPAGHKASIREMIDASIVIRFISDLNSRTIIAKRKEIGERVAISASDSASRIKESARIDRRSDSMILPTTKREKPSSTPRAIRFLASKESLANIFFFNELLYRGRGAFVDLTRRISTGIEKRHEVMVDVKRRVEHVVDAIGLKWGSADMARFSDAIANGRLLARVVQKATFSSRISPITEAVRHGVEVPKDVENEVPGFTFYATKMELVQLLGVIRREYSRGLIKGGTRIRFGSQADVGEAHFSLTEEQMLAVEQLLYSDRDVRILMEAFRDLYNIQGAMLLQEYTKQHNGTAMILQGDYFPVRRGRKPGDPEDELAGWTFKDPASFTATMQSTGMVRDTTGDKTRPLVVEDALVALNNHFWIAATLAHLSLPMYEMSKVLDSEPVRDTILRHYGSGVIEWHERLLDAMNREVVGQRSPREVKLATQLIRQGQTAMLAYRLTTALNAPLSLLTSMHMIGKKAVLAGITRASDMTTTAIISRNGYLRHRANLEDVAGNMFEAAQGQPAGFGGRASAWSDPTTYLDPDILGERGLILMKKLDAFTIRAIVASIAAKREPDQKIMTANEWLDSVGQEAVQVIVESQPTGDAFYSTGFGLVARQQPFFRMLILFRSQVGKNWNLVFKRYVQWRREPSAANFRSAVEAFTFAVVLQSVLINLLRSIWRETKGTAVGNEFERALILSLGEMADFSPFVKPSVLLLANRLGFNAGMVDTDIPSFVGDVVIAATDGITAATSVGKMEYGDHHWWVAAMSAARAADKAFGGTGITTLAEDLMSIGFRIAGRPLRRKKKGSRKSSAAMMVR